MGTLVLVVFALLALATANGGCGSVLEDADGDFCRLRDGAGTGRRGGGGRVADGARTVQRPPRGDRRGVRPRDGTGGDGGAAGSRGRGGGGGPPRHAPSP